MDNLGLVNSEDLTSTCCFFAQFPEHFLCHFVFSTFTELLFGFDETWIKTWQKFCWRKPVGIKPLQCNYLEASFFCGRTWKWRAPLNKQVEKNRHLFSVVGKRENDMDPSLSFGRSAMICSHVELFTRRSLTWLNVTWNADSKYHKILLLLTGLIEQIFNNFESLLMKCWNSMLQG